MKTPIIYYGGKSSMLNHILPLIPPHDVYTEAFFGGGTVFFEKSPAMNETINDTLDIVINFYRQLKMNFEELKNLVESTLISRTLHREALSIIRHKEQHSAVQVAWAFWLSTTFSFNNTIGGGLKWTKDGQTNVPCELKNKKIEFGIELAKRLENATIENKDALEVIQTKDSSEAFHYIDPPYIGADQGHYAGYKEEDFVKLLDLLGRIKGKFLLSNYNSEILDEYVKINNWHKMEFVKNLQACKNKGRKKTEVLVWNYDLEDELFK